MKSLYDNFEMNSLVDEIFTKPEEKEQEIFIEALLDTSVMKSEKRIDQEFAFPFS